MIGTSEPDGSAHEAEDGVHLHGSTRVALENGPAAVNGFADFVVPKLIGASDRVEVPGMSRSRERSIPLSRQRGIAPAEDLDDRARQPSQLVLRG